jgi:YVTN family beta-propeller protein
MRGSRVASVLLAATVTLAASPAARAASYAYIPGSGGDVVSRMDLASNEASLITVGDGPIGVAGSADGAVVVVTNQSDGTASVIDGASASVTWTVPVGTYPRGVTVTPDGTRAYVANTLDQTISVIDTASGIVSRTIAVSGQMGGMAMSPDGKRAYVANASFGGTLLVIDTATDVVLTESLLSETSYVYEVVASPDGTRVYAAVDSAVVVVDAATNLAIDRIPVSDDCCTMLRGIAVTPDGARVYAALSYPGGVAEIDTATRTVTPIPTSAEFSDTGGVGVSPDGTTLYAINSGSGTVDLIDVATRMVRATLGALVESPWASGDFIVGPTPPVVPPPPPVLGSSAQACQKALLDSFKTFGAKSHQLLSGCLLRIQKDRASGPVTSATTTACSRDVGPAATSRLAKARAIARQRILAGCASSTPAALGPPCDAEASTLAELADCALDRQLAGVTGIVDGEIAGACALLAQVVLDGALPALCP